MRTHGLHTRPHKLHARRKSNIPLRRLLAALAVVAATVGSAFGFASVPAKAASGGEFTQIYEQWANGPDPSGSPTYFPIGVFYQDFDRAASAVGNEDSVIAYDAAGINLQVGGYDCDNGGCPGGARDPELSAGVADNTAAHPVACACDVMGTSVAGESAPYTEITNERNNPNTIGAVVKVQFILGYDEADMNEVDYPVGSAYASPAVAAAYAAVKAADPTRPVEAGFGRCFSIPNWDGCQAASYNGAGETEAQSLAQYCQNVDIIASDNYADSTNQYYDGPGHNYEYGLTVDNERAICGPDKVVGFYVETGFCCDGDSLISPQDVEAATWDGILHGAHELIYFVDDFDSSGGQVYENGLLATGGAAPGVLAQVTADDQEISALAPWLNAPSESGVTASGTNGVPITTMLKSYDGADYLFAMADGNGADPLSGSTTATITLPNSYGSVATVYGEGRSVTLSAGNTLTDSFSPYQMHVYDLGSSGSPTDTTSTTTTGAPPGTTQPATTTTAPPQTTTTTTEPDTTTTTKPDTTTTTEPDTTTTTAPPQTTTTTTDPADVPVSCDGPYNGSYVHLTCLFTDSNGVSWTAFCNGSVADGTSDFTLACRTREPPGGPTTG